MRTFLLLCCLLVGASVAKVTQDCHFSNEYFLASQSICDQCGELIAEENIGEKCEENCFWNEAMERCLDVVIQRQNEG
uniref:Secretory peptide n=1 Tax=Heteropoda venatoria TaxID=152925 RepID=A0A088BPN6_HETVE|nr:secretory peptide [Heteropoda venatoria]